MMMRSSSSAPGEAWSSPPPLASARLRKTSMCRASSKIWLARKSFTSWKSWLIRQSQVAGDELDLGELGAELADRALDVVGQGLEALPGDVPRRAPLACDGFLVELGGVVGPDHRPLVHVVGAERRRPGRHLGAARRHAPVGGTARGDLAVGSDVDVAQREPER